MDAGLTLAPNIMLLWLCIKWNWIQPSVCGSVFVWYIVHKPRNPLHIVSISDQIKLAKVSVLQRSDREIAPAFLFCTTREICFCPRALKGGRMCLVFAPHNHCPSHPPSHPPSHSSTVYLTAESKMLNQLTLAANWKCDGDTKQNFNILISYHFPPSDKHILPLLPHTHTHTYTHTHTQRRWGSRHPAKHITNASLKSSLWLNGGGGILKK